MKPLFDPHMLLSEHFTLGEMLDDVTIPRRAWPFCYTTTEQIARLLFEWMKDNIDYDQLILEHSGSAWWVHVSCRVNFRHNRHERLLISNGKTTRID